MSGSPSGPELPRTQFGKTRHRVYQGVLIFVVLVGLPIASLPPLRHRLQVRIEVLRSSILGIPSAPAPAFAQVGENREPFPLEYERPQVRPPAFTVAAEPPSPPQTFRTGAGASTGPGPPPKAEIQISPPATITGTTAAPIPATVDAASDPQYKKGKSEQEAYDLLLNANQTLAGMVRGADAALKFQDWSAASMGNESYYVMVTFVQTSDSIVRQYIWNVKMMTKEVLPLSSYARSISK